MTTLAERVEVRVAQWNDFCRANEIFLSGDGRVAEADAAALLGINRGYLKDMRHLGKGPSFFRVPLNGARVCYSLIELAQWVEQGRDVPANDG